MNDFLLAGILNNVNVFNQRKVGGPPLSDEEYVTYMGLLLVLRGWARIQAEMFEDRYREWAKERADEESGGIDP